MSEQTTHTHAQNSKTQKTRTKQKAHKTIMEFVLTW